MGKIFMHKINNFWKKFFSLSNIDSHIVIFIFGIQIKLKYKPKKRVPIISEYGLTIKKRNPRIILSLTSFPTRINYVHITIKTLLNQSLKPDKIILWLAKEQFPNKENDLPENLLSLKKYGLSLGWCEDLKSYKKLIPAIKEYPEDIIITFDDDVYYESDTVETLYKEYLKNPQNIYAHRIWRVKIDNNQILALPSSEMYWNWKIFKNASFFNTVIGCGGVLYPPKSLYKDILDKNMIKKIVPTQDDIYFWGMAVLNNTKIQLVKGYSYNHCTVENTQKSGLCKINRHNSQGMSGQEAFNKIVEFYPEIKERLKKETVNV